MSDDKIKHPNTFIKDVAIEISNNYPFDNLPHANEKEQKDRVKPFIGRDQDRKKFHQMLNEGNGVFLVTGYRGVGKTSFVNTVLRGFANIKSKSFVQSVSEHFSKLFIIIKNCIGFDIQITSLYKVGGNETQLNLISRELEKGVEYFIKGDKDLKDVIKETASITKKSKPIEQRNQKRNNKFIIDITISQKQPSEIEILRLMVSAIKEKMRNHFKIESKIKNKQKSGFLEKLLGISFILLTALYIWQVGTLKDLFYWGDWGLFDMGTEYIVLSIKLIIVNLPVLVIIYSIIKRRAFSIPDIYERIEKLFFRCYASFSEEIDSRSEIALEALNTKLSSSGKKRTENFPVASSKEIEHELTSFIRNAKEGKYNIEFVFVFDELDKVEQAFREVANENIENQSSNYNPEKAYLEQLRDRKQAILNIIAGLKNFLTSSDASFIFIAGREMFDASMADIADRQSSISSIFTYVFYVESFLKEKHSDNSSLSTSIEEYLFYIIHGRMPESKDSLYRMKYEDRKEEAANIFIDKKIKGLEKIINNCSIVNLEHIKLRLLCQRLIERLKDEKNDLAHYYKYYVKVNLLMQAYVVYLIYRSNGSPKKLIRIIHDFISVQLTKSELQDKISWNNNSRQTGTNKRYLHFNYKNQQRIGFINYLYRPFLVKFGSSFKKYSDNLIVSTSFLFDHLLKFHPFAFSLNHLELLPEVLSTNRTPALRDHIQKIIEYLSNNHLKETEIGLFDYKFYNKTINEIFYLSKTFEEESAAFNFTLDESYLTKLHVKGKIRDLRMNYEQYNNENGNPVIFSIAFLNGVLGDLCFFDQEYDDAAIAYSDAIKPINTLDMSKVGMRDFCMLILFRLKLGLTFEKMKSFEQSLAFYSEAIQDSKRFIMSRVNDKLIQHHLIPTQNNELGKEHYIVSSLSDTLQIINQAFLAQMVIQEKMGVEGMTARKSAITIGGFLQLSDRIEKYCGNNSTIIANFFLQIANLLYFKNSIIAFEWVNYEYNSIPDSYKKSIDDFVRFNKQLRTSSEYRKPIMALNIYMVGIKFLLEQRIFEQQFQTAFSSQFAEEKTINIILKNLNPSSLKKHFLSLSKIHFKYIAIFLSHIGDCLLSMLTIKKEDGHKTNGYSITEIIDVVQLDIFYKKLKLLESAKESLAKQNYSINPREAVQAWIIGNDISSTFSSDQFGTDLNSLTWSAIDTWDDLISKIKYAVSNRLEMLLKVGSINLDNKDNITPVTIICYYYLAAYYFKKCSRYRSFSFQLRKILFLLRLILSDKQEVVSVNIREHFIYIVEKIFVDEILEINSQTAEYSDINDYNKFIQLLNNDREKFIRSNLSNFPDTREVVLLFEHISLKIFPLKQVNKIVLVQSDGLISTQYLRLLELTYAAKLYETKIKIKKLAGTVAELDEIVGFLHPLLSIINIMDIYDNDYLVGNSFLAYHHYRIARFFTFDISKSTSDTSKVNEYGIQEEAAITASHFIRSISGNSTSFSLLDPAYHFRMAALNYSKSTELHSAGNEYKKAMRDILYLEDDLNDASYHFGAAMDRYLMVNGVFKNHLAKCKNNYEWNQLNKFV